MATVTKADVGAMAAQAMAGRYRQVRALTETLTAPLGPEDQMVQSCFESSPVKWHRAHTTWFFETFILAPHLHSYRTLDARFRFLFNSYYHNVGERPERTTRGMISRPSADDVERYREHVDSAIELLLAETDDPQVLALLELGLNHEQQHQELIVTDIKHAFWTNPLRPIYWPQKQHAKQATATVSWTEHEGGMVDIGHAGPGFAFDNETPRHRVFLEPYALASRLVSNREYLEFMGDGGYRTPTLWLSEGWDAVRTNGWRAPLYWEESDGDWLTFSCSGMKPLDLDEPVCHISYFEADAYARWREARLGTEFEWEHAAAQESIRGNFAESELFHPRAAQVRESQVFGDCWEWTSSSYAAYPGFHPAEGALGEYNGKFMCNQYVLRGGSCATPQSHIRPSYRNFFPAQTRWQFSGIRLAQDLTGKPKSGGKHGG